MIGSASNPRVKAAAALRQRSARLDSGLFLIEGQKEIRQAISAGVEIEQLFILDGIELPDDWDLPAMSATVLGREAFDRIAYGRDGFVAVAQSPSLDLSFFSPSRPELILVAEAIEKPGNLGAMMRTADAAGAAVLVTDPVTDLTNPNVVRASLGTLFTIELATSSTAGAIRWLEDREVPLLVADVEKGLAPWEIDLRGPVALAIGAEHQGLSTELVASARDRIKIPMAGATDSLNASSTAAILLFESVRQRLSQR
ncbi:MAG TPA: TrmH family RNA methyltransferase [Acidimicrobiia bacterium]|nr:TrmH family RNA methyltransferase [Acidimicrobiia bacterium]